MGPQKDNNALLYLPNVDCKHTQRNKQLWSSLPPNACISVLLIAPVQKSAFVAKAMAQLCWVPVDTAAQPEATAAGGGTRVGTEKSQG